MVVISLQDREGGQGLMPFQPNQEGQRERASSHDEPPMHVGLDRLDG